MNTNSTKNANKSMTSGFQKVLFWVLFIVFLMVIVYIIYYAWTKSQEKKDNEPIIVSDIIDANKARPGKSVPTPSDGMAQTMSTWIYVKSWDYGFGKYKNILWKGDQTAPRHSPSLWLYPLTNNLKVLTSTNSVEGVESCDINNIPLMKWVHICYVLNNRTVDVYINGKLERSCALKGIPVIKQDNVFITAGSSTDAGLAGFDGKIGKTQYFTRAILPHEVANLYNSGPIGASQYNIQFFQDGKFVQINDSTGFS